MLDIYELKTMFVNKVRAKIKDYLPEEYKYADIVTKECNKLNDSYIGMTVRQKDTACCPLINLDIYFEQFLCRQKSIEEIMCNIAEVVQHHESILNSKNILKDYSDYSSVKDKLFIRLSNEEENRKMLPNIPHNCIEDLIITYHVLVSVDNEGIGSYTVNNQMLKEFGIEIEQLHQDALNNSVKLFPIKVEPLIEIIRNKMQEEMKVFGLNEAEIAQMINAEFSQEIPALIVTNKQMMYGAAAIFYPGQMECIAKLMKGDYFILPSSIHETLIMPDNGEYSSSKDLKKMVIEVNSTEVNPSEKLSDEIYHFDAKTKIFKKIDVRL